MDVHETAEDVEMKEADSPHLIAYVCIAFFQILGGLSSDWFATHNPLLLRVRSKSSSLGSSLILFSFTYSMAGWANK